MNERVWLQSGCGFVNKRGALLCVFSLAALIACGEPEQAAELDSPAPSAPAAQAKPAPALEVPAIWESEAHSDPFQSLAIMSNAGNDVFVAGVDEAGVIKVYDLDGAPVAESNDTPSPLTLAAGAGIFGETAMLAPALSANGELLAIVIETSVGGVARLSLGYPGTFDVLCAGSHSDKAIPVALGAGRSLTLGRLSVIDDAAVFEPEATLSLDEEVTGCALSGGAEVGGVATTEAALYRFTADDVAPIGSIAAEIQTLSLVDQLASPLVIGVDRDGRISAIDLTQPASDPKAFDISAGLSVGAPAPGRAAAAIARRIGPDFVGGLLAVTGDYEDGRPRITYVDIGSIREAFE